MICPTRNIRHFQEFVETCPACDRRRFVDRVLRVVGVIVFGIAIAVQISYAHDNGIVYKPAPKPTSTVAENITAGGRVAAGAFDRLFKSEK